jgi:hypothetical protein
MYERFTYFWSELAVFLIYVTCAITFGQHIDVLFERELSMTLCIVQVHKHTSTHKSTTTST